MRISDETKKLIEKINDYSKKHIKNNFEVSIIIESGLSSNNRNIFNDLIFKAKYVKGLKSVLSNRVVIGDDYMEKIFIEFNKNLQLFIDLLKDILASSDGKIMKHFNNKYFDLNQESILNSMDLVEDLAICKEFFINNSEELLKQ